MFGTVCAASHASIVLLSSVWYPAAGAFKKTIIAFFFRWWCSMLSWCIQKQTEKLYTRSSFATCSNFLNLLLVSFHNHLTTFSLLENNLSKILNQFFAQKSKLKILCVVDISKVYLLSPHWRHSEEIDVHCMPLLLFISSYCMWRYGQSSSTTLRILNPLCRHCPEKRTWYGVLGQSATCYS